MLVGFYFIPDANWLFAGLFGAALLVPVGLSFIFYNAFLPVLVENHWLMRGLKHKYKHEDTDTEYAVKHKQLLQTTQDEVSQFGYGMGYIGSFVAAALAGLGLVLLEDTTTQLTPAYTFGSGSGSVQHPHEYFMKHVVAIDVWTSNLSLTQSASSENVLFAGSFLHGIQLTYAHSLDGGVYGVTNASQLVLDYDADNVVMHSHFAHTTLEVDAGDEMTGVELFLDTHTQLLQGIAFETTLGDDTLQAGNCNLSVSQLVRVRPDEYPRYELAGYRVSTDVFAQSDTDTDMQYNVSLPLISGFSLAFMDIAQGQYGSTLDNRLIYALTGVWSLLFSMPAFLVLRSRTKPKRIEKASGLRRWLCPPVCTVSLKDYYQVFVEATRYPHLFRCLVAWFIWSDAENTTATIAILFGQKELGLSALALLLLLLEVQLLAFAGNVLFVWLQRRLGWTSKQLVVLHLAISSLLPIWTIFGV